MYNSLDDIFPLIMMWLKPIQTKFIWCVFLIYRFVCNWRYNMRRKWNIQNTKNAKSTRAFLLIEVNCISCEMSKYQLNEWYFICKLRANVADIFFAFSFKNNNNITGLSVYKSEVLVMLWIQTVYESRNNFQGKTMMMRRFCENNF